MICSEIARLLIGQAAWWFRSLPKLNHHVTTRDPCYGTFCRPCTICRRDKLYLRWRHISSPHCTIWRLATKCAAVVHTVLGRQSVPCRSAYFVVPHLMDLNILSNIYLLNMKEAIYYILWYVYIIFMSNSTTPNYLCWVEIKSHKNLWCQQW